MNTFIQDVLQALKDKSVDFSKVFFVLPSKRAGVFLKSKLHLYIAETSFAPEIISIEDFVQDVSKLRQVSGVELLFQFYTVYKTITPKDKIELFETFSKWAQILIQDFNEIDRYLIPSNHIFDYLSAIQELNHWSADNQQTQMVTNYLSFWKNLKIYYNKFTEELTENGSAYQGLIYKVASDNIEEYINATEKNHVFLGFNALNKSEENIIQKIINKEKGEIYWDIDKQFIDGNVHSAGFFTRQHRKNWSYYEKKAFNWVTTSYKENIKNINAIGCPKSVGQSKYIGHLLNKFSSEERKKTAVVLGDEELLTPVLNALPKSISSVNVTMGLPLKSIPLASLFEQLFGVHKLKAERYYFKYVIALVSNQMIQYVLKSGQEIIQNIQQNNIVYLTKEDIQGLAKEKDKETITLLFGDWHQSMSDNITKCISLIKSIKKALNFAEDDKRLELEYLYRFNALFNEISSLNAEYNYINDVSTLYSIYKELLSTETIDFQGEPLEGLQIMGMLESRVLDFETVIISSVNEGILPGGKTNNSFIAFDVKIENGLPTYKEKDAVYTYHFYSLIQRAKNVYLIYNTEVDALKGGEKSRFITQLEVENIHNITHKLISPKIPINEKNLTEISKDDNVLKSLKAFALNGFSPSSLTNYIRNPIDFYFEKILGVKNVDEVEETVAANTLGTVVHNTLEDFYKPFEGKFINVDDIKKMQQRIDKRITHHFKKEYKQGEINRGQNLIIYEIAKRYVSNFLKDEIELLKDENNRLKILAIEVDNNIKIKIPELDFPIILKGKVDRVDLLNGIVRVIDYKSGKVEQSQVEIIDWNDINTDYKKYSKSFQILCYAYMLTKQNIISTPLEAGIISFKNLKSGLLKFATKPAARGKRDHKITDEVLQNFEIQLKNLILEICNPNIEFTEKELD